jgi:type VI secretion system secreted protein Hcp
MTGYLSVDGIKGSARPKHAQGKSTAIAVSHDVETGPDGKPRHRPFVVTKEIDAASPGLHKAQAEGRSLGSVSVEFWRMPPAGGQDENYYTITMSNAKVVSIRTVMANSRAAESAQQPDVEEVGFSYESIDWSFKSKNDAGGTSSEREVGVNPAPDKLEEMARSVLTDAAKKLGETLKAAAVGAAKEATAPPPPPQ